MRWLADLSAAAHQCALWQEYRAEPNPTSFELLAFVFWRTTPWIGAFAAVALFMRGMPDALGSTLALVIAYAIVAGAIFSAICLIVFSAFNTAHRRVAVRQLLARSRWPLFAIGACGALGDAMANPIVTGLLGVNLAGLVSASANVTAAVLIGYFALAYRRPVTHLIRNRPYGRRRDHKLATEALDISHRCGTSRSWSSQSCRRLRSTMRAV